MVTIEFTPKAIEDIENLAEYIAIQSPHFAQKLVKSIFNEVDILKTFPFIGRIVPEINENEVREIFYQKYRIVYHVIDQYTIHIVTIQHGSRDVKNWF
jgi:addiction module RelE/StbE family toxin